MWPLPRISGDAVAISFSPQAISFAWIAASADKFKHHLKAFQTTLFDQNDALLVPMRLCKPINEFLGSNKIADANVFISLNEPAVTEKIITLPIKDPAPEQFEQPYLQSMIWDSQLLYQNDYGHWTFYLSCMHPEVLFQYKLLAAGCNLNLRSIVPRFGALLQLHREIKKDLHENGRFGDHMMTQHNNIQSLITIDDLASFIAIDRGVHFNSPNDFELIKELIGGALGDERE